VHPLTTEPITEDRPTGLILRQFRPRQRVENLAPVTTRPRIAAIVVTWNRRAEVDRVLGALSRQDFPRDQLDVVIIDNASTDGTADFLIRAWRPQLIVENPTHAAHLPDFRVQHTSALELADASNAGGFASLALVRNTHNHGGCGGFNTGLAFLEHFLDSTADPLDYAWLIDDDVDLPPDALVQLTAAAQADPRIGIVGSRTVDFDQRDITTETTIYFDFERGWMGPEPTPQHHMHAAHHEWATRAGGTRGPGSFGGIRDVDVVPASSMLARWSAVKQVGFWDSRFFIYCDDADWCLRIRAAGYRVVCNLDAVVYHTYWLSKLTPTRAYYSQRNLIWVIRKTLRGMRLKRALFRRLGSLLVQSFKAMLQCRLFHAEIIRRTAHDAITGRGGRLDHEGPPRIPIMDALHHAGALTPDATIMVMCSHHESIAWADDLRAFITHTLLDQGRLHIQPRWIYMVREDVPDPQRATETAGAAAAGPANATCLPQRIIFQRKRRHKWQVQRPLLRCPPTAVVVFDQCNEFPLLHSRCNIHLDWRRLHLAQLERDGPLIRARLFLRLLATALLCILYAAAARHRPHRGKYG
jgi:GT2 family glycosyltransferase